MLHNLGLELLSYKEGNLLPIHLALLHQLKPGRHKFKKSYSLLCLPVTPSKPMSMAGRVCIMRPTTSHLCQ